MKHIAPITLFLAAGAFAQTNVALTGKLIDTQGNPIPDIEIELSSLGLRDTTDGTGQWSINANTPIRNNGTALPLDARFSGNVLSLSLAQSAKVQIEISDIAGQRTSILGEQALAAGKHQIELGQKLPYGTYFLRVWAGQLSRTFRVQYSSLDNQIHASEQGAATITDKLVYRFQGQFLTEDQISKYEQYIEKFLQIRNISGQFTPGTTSPKKISVLLGGSSMPLPITLQLGWISLTNTYSGKVYSVKPLGSDVFTYSAVVNAFDSLNHKTTISDTLAFDSKVGDVNFPAKPSGNALPQIALSLSKDSLRIGDSLRIIANSKDSLGKLMNRQYRWNSGPWQSLSKDTSAKSFATDTISTQFAALGFDTIFVKEMDDDSNFTTISKTVKITTDQPKNWWIIPDNNAIDIIGSLTVKAVNPIGKIQAIEYKCENDNWIDVGKLTVSNDTSSVLIDPVCIPLDSSGKLLVRSKSDLGNYSNNDTLQLAYNGSFYDYRDGNNYHTIKINGKTWMAENLRFSTTGAQTNSNGLLYDWATALGLASSCNSLSSCNVSATQQGVCPSGWHVATDNDWKNLESFAGMTPTDLALEGSAWRGAATQIDKKFKSTKTWNARSGTNLLGLSITSDGTVYGHYWTSTKYTLNSMEQSTEAFAREFYSGNYGILRGNFDRTTHMFVRCVKN